jgi:hypothetical protein
VTPRRGSSPEGVCIFCGTGPSRFSTFNSTIEVYETKTGKYLAHEGCEIDARWDEAQDYELEKMRGWTA